MVQTYDLLHGDTYKFPWVDTSNTPRLKGILTYICLIEKLLVY